MTIQTPSARRAGGLTVWHVLVAIGCLLAPIAAHAATPASGTVSASNLTVTWTGNPQPPTASATCSGANNAACDNFKLTIVPPSYSFAVEITAIAGPSDDYDMEVYGPDGTLLDNSGAAPGQQETVILNNPAAGTYTVSLSNYAAVLAYNGQAQIVSAAPPPPPGDPDDAVSFSIHTPPTGVGTNSGEPSIGCNWNTDRTMFIAGLETLRLDWNDCTSPPRETWTDVSFLTTSIITLDPILFTDSITGRTFASQLSAKCSSMAFTDDDGATWTPSQGCGINAGVDHQTVGGGPFHEPLTRDPNGLLYPHAVYYCSQDVAIAQCARSDDGGVTFGPAVPIYNISECGGLHGHVKVAPDGTVYVPAKGCNGEQAVSVSEDNGITWEVRRVPGTSAGTWDPAVGISDDGTVYLGMTNGGHPYAAVSRDQGRTWEDLQDIGTDFGIQNTAFPVAVGGDADRAAIGFLGAPQGGAGGGQDVNSGHIWHPYVAVTYDGGDTWTTVNLTPDDPAQRGTICSAGTTCNSTRNLLDFNDMWVDREGRIMFGYADGCIGSCAKQEPNSASELATVARQKSGKRLFEAFDTTTVPAAPLVTATIENEGTSQQFNRVEWEEPFDGNSPILGYDVYRRRDDETTRTLIGSVDDSTFLFDDNTTVATFDYFYSVSATNAFGEGASCGEVKAGGGPDDPDPTHCVLPGISVAKDLVGDTAITAAGDRSLDIVELSAAEPSAAIHGEKLFVTIEVDDMTVPHPSAAWRALWTSPDSVTYFVSLESCDATAGLQCSYGTFDGTLFSAQGNLADCSFTPDGEITIGVDKALVGISDAADSGKGLGGFAARTQVFAGALCSGLLSTTDSAGPGSYTIKTNASCDGQPPIARDDSATTNENVPVVADVIANDTSFNGALTVIQVSAPANGQVANNGDGTLTYNPDVGFSGVDAFTYTIKDAGGLQDSADVTVTVTPRCPPTDNGSFSDDFEPTAEDGWLVATPVNNLGPLSPAWAVTADSGATSPTNSFFTDATTVDEKDDRLIAPAQDLSASSHLVFFHRFETEATYDGGVLEVSTDGGDSWAEVVAAGGSFVSGAYNGVIDSGFGSAIAGRAAWTGGSSADPMAQVEVDLGALAGNDVWVRWRFVADPLAPGSVPGAGWWIDDVSFTNLTEPGVCVNRAPTPEDDFATTDENQAVTIDVLANDSDPDGDAIAVNQVGAASNGTTTLNGNGTVTYEPDAGFSGTDSFEYEVCDYEPKCASATVTVLVNDENLAPTANDDVATTEEATPVTIQVLANDTDPENEPLSIGTFSQGSNGSVTDNGDGTLTYSPDEGFTGADSFTYEACDPPGLCDEATVTVTVNPGPTGGSGKVTGGGWIADSSADGKANFGFNAKSKPSGVDGRLTYDSGSGGVNVKGTASSLTISGNTAQFSGVCSYTGGACTFRVTVEDNGEPGSSDRFAIEVMNAAGATVHSADAILGGGNIQIH